MATRDGERQPERPVRRSPIQATDQKVFLVANVQTYPVHPLDSLGDCAKGPVAPEWIYLEPTDAFPESLADLTVTQLQVLHSRICSQLDWEYLTDPAGPHPVTLDRRRMLLDALDARVGTQEK